MNANWKATLQLRDLDPEREIEFRCKACGRMYLKPGKELLKSWCDASLWLDQIEDRERCIKCKGPVMLYLLHKDKLSAFIGGMP